MATTTLAGSLKKKKVEITLVLKDGSSRVINATTNPALIDNIPSNGMPNRERLGMITVFDVDSKQWRSFKESQVIAWKVL